MLVQPIQLSLFDHLLVFQFRPLSSHVQWIHFISKAWNLPIVEAIQNLQRYFVLLLR